MHNSGTSRRENAEVRANLSVVIVRESGRSSIPETSVILLRERSVLDTPACAGHDSGGVWEAAPVTELRSPTPAVNPFLTINRAKIAEWV
jgi:hypothetical protein